MVERRCATLIRVLKALCGADRSAWAQHLGTATHILNHSVCRTTGYSPFHARYGHPARSALAAEVGLFHDDSFTVEEHLATLANATSLMLVATGVAQAEAKRTYDGARVPAPFAPGDFVLRLGSPSGKLGDTGIVHRIAARVSATEYLIHRPLVPAELHRVPATLLRPYDQTRTDLATDAVRGLAPGTRIISRIVSHTRDPAGRLSFTVGFADGSTQPLWTAADLRRLTIYAAYTREHKLPK
jgi:hypothetical protein